MAWGNQRTRTAAWARTRRQVLARDDDICQRCGDVGTEVNHIVAHSEGGTDDLDNLEAICASCHQRETVAQTTRAVRRHASWGRHPGDPHPGLA